MTTSSSPPVARWSKRRILIALAVALAIGEFVGALSIDWPAGILFVAGAYWIRRGGIGGPILVGLLAARAYVAHYVGGASGQGCGPGGSSEWACSTLDASRDVGAFWMGIAARPVGIWGAGGPWVSYFDRERGALKVAILKT